jgi:Carboxypeptidase regulatory-like domain
MRFLLIFLSIVTPSACAQSEEGTIRGFICDVSWNAIRGAAVAAKNAQTSMTYSATSSGNGNYAITDLPAGEYTVTVTMLGMKTYAHAYVRVRGEVQEDVELQRDDPEMLSAVYRGRDFYDRDGEFVLTPPVMILNGSGLELSQHSALIKGKIVWIYIPGQGRSLLSLAPHAEFGFKVGGEISGTTLKFRAANAEIRVDSSDRIVAGSATYRLYVLDQPNWLPSKETDRSMTLLGSQGRPDAP